MSLDEFLATYGNSTFVIKQVWAGHGNGYTLNAYLPGKDRPEAHCYVMTY